MATYIANLTDAITPIELFRPDWQFFQSTLQNLNYKQKLYENSLNNSFYYVAEANITNPENINLRNEFLANYKNKIEKLAQLDLTKSENIAYARSLFTPLLENESYLHDLNFTKRHYDELSKANESFSDYNEDSKLAIQYRLKEYANAPLEKRLSMTPIKYIPKVNEMELITDYFKKHEPTVQTVDLSKDGKYIITYKNGKQAEVDMQNYIYDIISNDPRIVESEKQKAYVTRMKYIDTYGYDKGYELYKNIVAEKMNILKNTTILLTDKINEYNKMLSSTNDAIDENKKTLDTLNTFGLDDSEYAKKITTDIDALTKRRDFLLKNIQSALMISKQNSQLINIYDKKNIMDSQLYDNIVAQANMVDRANKYGKTFSSLKSSVSIAANPIYLQQMKDATAITLQQMENANALEVAKINAGIKVDPNSYEIINISSPLNNDDKLNFYKGPGKNAIFNNFIEKLRNKGKYLKEFNNENISELTNNNKTFDINEVFKNNVPNYADNKNKINYAILTVKDKNSPNKYKYYLIEGEYGQQTNFNLFGSNDNYMKPILNNIYYTEIDENDYNELNANLKGQ